MVKNSCKNKEKMWILRTARGRPMSPGAPKIKTYYPEKLGPMKLSERTFVLKNNDF